MAMHLVYSSEQCNFQAENSGWAIPILFPLPPLPLSLLSPFLFPFPPSPLLFGPLPLPLKRRSEDITPRKLLKFFIAAGEFLKSLFTKQIRYTTVNNADQIETKQLQSGHNT